MKTRRATLRTSNPASMSASRRRRRRLHRRRCQRRRRLSPITCQRLLHCQTSGDRRSSTSSKKHGGCSRRAWSRLDHRARRRPSPQSGPTTPRDQYYKTEYAITQITARFWFIIIGVKWVQTSTYFICFIDSIRITSNWKCKVVAGKNSNHASKSSQTFTAIVIRQNQFYSIDPRSYSTSTRRTTSHPIPFTTRTLPEFGSSGPPSRARTPRRRPSGATEAPSGASRIGSEPESPLSSGIRSQR